MTGTDPTQECPLSSEEGKTALDTFLEGWGVCSRCV